MIETYLTGRNSDNYDVLPSLGIYPQLIIMSLAGTFIVKFVVETKNHMFMSKYLLYTLQGPY